MCNLYKNIYLLIYKIAIKSNNQYGTEVIGKLKNAKYTRKIVKYTNNYSKTSYVVINMGINNVY